MKSGKKNDSDLPGFSVNNKDESNTILKHKKAKKGCDFKVMGFSAEVLKGIIRRGYKVPTPIQRKTIPLILEGRDVVAMAKTGSGKTACFLLPLFEKLKCRQATTGARALILSPTRELSIQTFKFIKELGRFMNLKTTLVLGGESISEQFSAIHSCPDIIVATPGRFLHLCVEMDLKLNSMEYIVFDEADRLFEMGFGGQLNEIIHRLPESRQLVMFSATLPKLLVDFAKADLSDPVLIRLDVETKIPSGLTLKFIHCRSNERYSVLISLLKYVIPERAQTIVFAGTQHHVELIAYLLTQAEISNTMIYSTMDATARKINTAKFQLKQVSVLVVTDIAARGIDIPNLDYVINLHFPGKPKLFVHRVGRCARAGRDGTAYSIFSVEDEAHLVDLHLFLNRPFIINDRSAIGIVPQDILEDEHSLVLSWLADLHISGVHRTSINAYKKYLSTREPASADSNKRVKQYNFSGLSSINDFVTSSATTKAKVDVKEIFLSQMQNFRPKSGTVFELNPQQKSIQYEVMKNKRKSHGEIVKRFNKTKRDNETIQEMENKLLLAKGDKQIEQSTVNDIDIENTFNKVITSRKPQNTNVGKNSEHYIPYHSVDKHTEDGLAINSFERQAQQAELSLSTKSNIAENVQFKQGMKKWDRIKKKMVSVQDPRIGKIRTESGAWISSTYKTGRYNEWKEKSKIEEQIEQEEPSNNSGNSMQHPIRPHWQRHNAKLKASKPVVKGDVELRNPEQIVKQRLRLEFIKKRNVENRLRKIANRKKHLKKQRQKQKVRK